jgi:hypothetical protein
MRRNVLLNLCLMILAIHVYAADGATQDIDRICRFTFPGTPQVTQVPGLRNYLYETDSCSYLVQVKPVTKKGVVADTTSLYAFYGGVVNGILRGFHATLIGKKSQAINGLRGYEVEYVKGDKDRKPVSMSTRMLLLGDRLVVFTFSAPFSRFISLKPLKEKFFASFSLQKDSTLAEAVTAPIPASDTTPTPAYDSVKAGRHIAGDHPELVRSNTLKFIISFAASILLLAGTLYILVRWKKRKAGN